MVGIKSKMHYNLTPRPDNPGKYTGFEEVTSYETAKWWIYSYIRPDAHLVLGIHFFFFSFSLFFLFLWRIHFFFMKNQ